MAIGIDYQLNVPTGVSASIIEGGDVVFELPPFTGADSWKLRFAEVPDPTGTDVYQMELVSAGGGGEQFEGGAVFFPDDKTIYLQLQPIDADGNVGPWSNGFPLVTPEIVHLELKDFKKIIGTQVDDPAQPADIDLTTMTDPGSVGQVRTGLDFADGDLVMIVAAAYRNGAGAIDITRGVATGWSEAQFHAAALGAHMHGVRVLYKIADGTEDVVPIFVASGGTGLPITTSAVYYAMAFTVVGTPIVYSAPAGQTTSGSPPTLVLVPASGAQQDPVIAFSIAVELAFAAPDVTFSETPDINETTSGGTFLASRLKVRLFGVDSEFNDVSATMPDQGNVNTFVSGAILLQQEVIP